MDSRLYNKSVSCPVCMKEFEVTKVKTNGSKISYIDTDYCVVYEGINPIVYDVWVCEHCGYASQSDKFEKIPFKEAKLILSEITPKWKKRSYAGERTVEQAIDTFKLVLLEHDVRNSKPSELAKVCIRISWLYRALNDPREKDFLRFALENYSKAFETERFPIDKLDEYTCMYLIGELNRRLDNLEEASKWFSKLISSPDARRNSKLIENTRDQFQLVKEALGTSTPE